MLFQRILSNCTLDWFRRQKTRNALFSNMSDFDPGR
jgi:RNA polymerase sigma-70 factor (ECF subfamily)